MNVGIIGAGGIARKLHLPQLAEIDSVNITWIAGRKPSRLGLLAEQFRVANWTMDHHEMLADPDLDAVVIALPHPLHVPIGLEAISAGKHVLMQKPLCADMSEADKFVHAVEHSDRIVYALPNYSPEIYAARDIVRQVGIGKLSGAHCRVSHGGPEVYYAEIRDYFGEDAGDLWFFNKDQASVGALFDMGVYAVGALVAILGEVTAVTGVTATVDKPTELEDTATLILRFANGAVAAAETGWCDPARSFQISVHGTRGKLTCPGVGGAGITRWEPGSYTREDVPAVPYEVSTSAYEARNAHESWLNCITQGRQPEVSNVWAARHITEILLAGLDSAATGKTVAVHSKLPT